MKYDCQEEFDLHLIYQKLTSQSCTQTVKACNFFTTNKSLLASFQKRLAQATPVIAIK